MEWDKNEWQGRRRDQVERNNKITFYVTIILLLTILGILIVEYF
jgi:uncharacterized membrane protein YidH (DUF202 family)